MLHGHRLGFGVLVLVAGATLAACGPDTVTIGFAPDVGATYEYRYDVESSTTRLIENENPESTMRSSRILASHEVLASDDGDVRLSVVVRRDGEAARTYTARFDRAAQLAGIDLIDGVRLGTIGEVSLQDIFTGAVAAPPLDPLAPGDSWTIESLVELPDDPVPVPLTGTGRLLELGVDGGRDLATVESEIRVPVSALTADRRTALVGEQVAEVTVVYDLADGSVVEARSTTIGEVQLTVQPPLGAIGPPAEGWLRYEIRTTTTRLD